MSIWSNKKWVPMLLHEVAQPFDSKDYVFELKFDGIRAVIFASPNKIIVQSRNKEDITHLFPELEKIKELVKKNTIFDGEIVAFQNHKPSFSKLQERIRLKNKQRIEVLSKKEPVIFVCFDILYQDKDLTSLNLLERKEILNKYDNNEAFIKNKMIDTKGKEFFKQIKKLDLEGIVAKRKDSNYLINKRTYNWVKIKNLNKKTFFIGGFTEKNKNDTITLYLGEKKNNKLLFVGKVSMAKKRELYKKIKKLSIKKETTFNDYNKVGINYINPQLKCQIEYLERTKNNHLRQPIFKDEK